MEITPNELKRLKSALDYMENALVDVVAWSNTPNDKIRYMYEVKRVHTIAVEEIQKIWDRKNGKP